MLAVVSVTDKPTGYLIKGNAGSDHRHLGARVVDIWLYLIDYLLYQPRLYADYHQVGLRAYSLDIGKGHACPLGGKRLELSGGRIGDGHRQPG